MNRYSRRVAGTVFLECECCSNALDTAGAWALAKQKGWRVDAVLPALHGN